MSSKDKILNRLRTRQTPFTEVEAITERHVIIPMDDANLLERFVQQAQTLSAQIYQVDDEQAAINAILTIVGTDKVILAWDFEHIPLVRLADQFSANEIMVGNPRDGSVRVGITGAEAALAATGSLVISAKDGRPRSISLLPLVHVAVIRKEQILPHLDAWLEQQSQDKRGFRDIGNHVVITGASRTADIGMELVLGAHGPAELHIIILP